jgi:cap1 methyltransferase
MVRPGDVYVSANLRHFVATVDAGTDGCGVDLLTCDGGFSVDGDENYQEERLRQLVLGQFLLGLTVVRVGGAFVCKLFDVFTPVTVALVYCLYRHYDRIAIVKPHTSRPANSER